MNRIRLLATIAPLTLVLTFALAEVAFAGTPPVGPSGGTGSDDGSSIGEYINTGIQLLLWNIVVSIFGFIAGIGGSIFDYALNTFVIGFGDAYLLTGVGQAVDTLWIYIRDFFNLLFIFGLVWLGLKMILNSGGADTKRWLGTLILAALLVNFSLYITKFIVDFSNIIAINILNASNFVPSGGAPSGDIEFSSAFMDTIGITTIFALNGTTLDEAAAKAVLGQGGYAYIFGTAIFLIITAFVFAAGGILLIIRFVVLSIYLLFSPFMFIGWILPQFANVQRQYWSGFLSRAFYAPVYVFLVWFSFFVLERYFSTSILEAEQDFANMMTGGGDAFQMTFGNTMIPFTIACILLIASIMVAQKLSIDGGSQAVRMFGQYRRKVPTMLSRYSGVGLGTRTASNAAGRGVNRGMSRIQARAQSIDTEAYRNKYRQGANRVFGNNSRASRAVGAVAAGVAGATKGVGTSTTIDRTARSGAKALQDTKYGMTNTEAQDRREKGVVVSRAERMNAEERGTAAREELRSIESGGPVNKTGRIYNPDSQAMEDRSSKTDDEIREILEKQRANMQRTVAGYTSKEVEEMAQQQPERLKAIVGELKPGTFEKGITDSEVIDAETKKSLRESRQTAIQESLKVNGEIMTDRIQKLTKQQMTELSDSFLRENAADFKQSQIDDYLKDDDIVQSQKDSLVAARKSEQIDRAGDPLGVQRAKLFNDTTYDRSVGSTGAIVPAVAANAKRKKAEEIANIPFDAYKDSTGNFEPNMINQLTGADLEKIYEKKTMTPQQRRELATAIGNSTSPSAVDAQNYLSSANGQRNWS